jgi:hypothetical protein
VCATADFEIQLSGQKEARERESMRPNGFIFTCVRVNSFAPLARAFFLVQFINSWW